MFDLADLPPQDIGLFKAVVRWHEAFQRSAENVVQMSRIAAAIATHPRLRELLETDAKRWDEIAEINASWVIDAWEALANEARLYREEQGT